MLSIIISTHGPSSLYLCLEGYRTQTHKNFELIIINDGGDDIIDVIKDFDDLLIKHIYFGPKTTKFRLAQARNIGISKAVGTRLVFTDADCIPSPTFLERHAENIDNSNIIIGVRTHIHRFIVPNIRRHHITDIREFIFKIDDRIGRLAVEPIYYYFLEYLAFGCNVSYNNNILKQIDGFDERFVGWGYEDIELATRARYITNCIPIIHFDSITYHLDHPVRKNIDSNSNKNILIQTRQRFNMFI